MRGKGSVVFAFRYQSGITPAHAGKRSASSPLPFYPWDHPRPCGEKFTLREYPPPETRITPAHAGKSPAVRLAWCGCRDHPRPCGEKVRRRGRSARGRGSPPPMRGKANQMLYHVCTSGITPAHAGKSAGRELYLPCGLGSPPPMRGKVYVLQLFFEFAGITPAHAGKRALHQAGSRGQEDHPRPCGEKGRLTSAPPETPGSPPPMRGKGRQSFRRSCCIGITPAHAGKRCA